MPCIWIHSQTLLLSVLCLEGPGPAARASGMSSTVRFFQRPGGLGVSTTRYSVRSSTTTTPPPLLWHVPAALACPFPMFSWPSSESSTGVPTPRYTKLRHCMQFITVALSFLSFYRRRPVCNLLMKTERASISQLLSLFHSVVRITSLSYPVLFFFYKPRLT